VIKSMSFTITLLRRLLLALGIVVGSLATARAINDGVVPPGFITVPLIVLSAAGAVALDALVIGPALRRR
jgi:hypothetical protein